MGNDVIINFDGNAASLQQATRVGAEALAAFQTSMKLAGDAAKIFNTTLSTEAIAAYARQLEMATTATRTLADAAEVISPAFADQAAAFLSAATSAEDYAARLDYVQAQVASASAATRDQASSLSMLADAFGGVAGAIGGFLEQSASFLTSLLAWSAIQQVIGWVQQLSSSLFDLEKTTEKNVTGWQYLFGGKHGPSPENAHALAAWSYKFSMGIPFTRQDLMAAMTTAGAAGMTTNQLEQFLPFLSDIASTFGSAAYGGQGTSLMRAMQAVRMAHEGMSRMLKYDLNISPQELVPYGLKMNSSGHITDPNSLYRALENFAVAKHVSNFGANGQDVRGASATITNTTWWGGFSSATDQLQNFLLQVGGTNANGTIRAGSFFAAIKNDLFSLMGWASQHQDQLIAFADTLSKLVGTAVSAGGGLLGQFFQWIGQLGASGSAVDLMGRMTSYLQQLFLGTTTTTTLNAGQATQDQLAMKLYNEGLPRDATLRGLTALMPHGPPTAATLHREHAKNAALHGRLTKYPETHHEESGWAQFMGGVSGAWQGFLGLFKNVDWSPIVNGWNQLATGWGKFVSAFQKSGAGDMLIALLKNVGQALLWLVNLGVFVPLELAFSSIGNSLAWFADMMLRSKPAFAAMKLYFDDVTTKLNQVGQAITGFTNTIGQLYNQLTRGDWGGALKTLENLLSLGHGGMTLPGINLAPPGGWKNPFG